MISELRYVIRSLLSRKGFALVTVLTLALGIGSATAIYSVVDWALFQQTPSPPNVYMVGSQPKDGSFMPMIMVPYYQAYSAQKSIFTDLCASAYRQGNVVVEHEPVVTTYLDVTPNFLELLGVTPFMGRGFLSGEDVDGRDQVCVVTFGFWKQHMGASPDALGRKITINQQECTVVGVLREGQRMPANVWSAVYHPLVLHYNPKTPWEPNIVAFAKARPGVTKAQIEDVLVRTKVDIAPDENWMANSKPTVSTIAAQEKIYRPEFYWTLLGAVGFLYAIACLNATNLMLVHMLGKQREISVRLALGGGRIRIIRLRVLEALTLSLCGSIFGALISNVLIPLFNMARSADTSGMDWGSWHLSWRTYIVLGGLSALTGLLISMIPAIHVLRSNIQAGLKNGGGAIGESPLLARLRGLFVVLQATFAVILLIGAGLMVETFARLEKVNVGYDPTHRVKLQLGYPRGISDRKEDLLAMLRRLKERLESVPGVANVAYSSESLMAQWVMTMDIVSKDGATPLHINPVYISPEYQVTSGMVLKGGRWISPEAKDEVMVSESLAKVRFGTTDVVGRYLKPTWGMKGDYKGWHIVGVVGDIRQRLRDPDARGVYMPISWAPSAASNFVVSLNSEPDGKLLINLRHAVFQFDPRIVVHDVKPLVVLRAEQLRDESLALSVLKVLAGIAIFLTVVGMFSVLAYTVDRRMAEFGIRMALGASPANLVALVMRRGISLTLLGIVIGIGGATALTRYMRSLLFETPGYDPVVIGAVALLLIVSALGACSLPASRASKPDLVKLLKSD